MAQCRREIFDGVLLDMDGTMISSIGAVEKHWENVGFELEIAPDMMAETLVATNGMRSIDVLQRLAPEKATWEYVHKMEALLPRQFSGSAKAIPGIKAFVASLEGRDADWGIVTSGSSPLVRGWLNILDIDPPEVLITAEMVDNGKPDPEPYRIGRDKMRLGGPDKHVLVGEDSPGGIMSAKAAGCFVIAVTTSATVEELRAAGADVVVNDWTQVRVAGGRDKEIELEIMGDLLLEDEVEEEGN